LLKEKLGENEIWDRAEAYFIRLTNPVTLHDRLSIWSWKSTWAETHQRALDFYNGIYGIYDIINNDENFIRLLGYILSVGNVLNGGSNKGQADGFDLAVLNKVHTFRDTKGVSIL